MKKALLLTNLLWLSIFLFMSFKPKTNPPINCDNINSNYTKEEFDGLNLQAATDMAKLYRANHLPKYISGRDARTIWFSLNTLKKFIWTIEHYNCMKLSDNIKLENLGIRIYYGEYPNASQIKEGKIWQGVNPEFQSLHTAFMVPTFWDGAVNHDFDPLLDYKTGVAGKGWKPIPLSNFIRTNAGTLANFSIISLKPFVEQKLGAQNHGGLCPPLCNNQDLAF